MNKNKLDELIEQFYEEINKRKSKDFIDLNGFIVRIDSIQYICIKERTDKGCECIIYLDGDRDLIINLDNEIEHKRMKMKLEKICI